MSSSQTDLRFGPGSPCGFTPSGIAGFSDLRPAAVVRELIQNALDAAVEVQEETAVVRFRLISCSTDVIPGMEAYNHAFRAAIRTQEVMGGGALPSQAMRVVDVMRKAIDQNGQDVLIAMDNGIGLDKDRMAALLSDGISNKSAAAMGTFGNGHSVAIPASDLRYVLYGGVTTSGDRIGAGHAVLASWAVPGEDFQRSGDGFLVNGFKEGSYVFAGGEVLPDLISDSLEDIKQNSGHGTAVIIPGFNNFRVSTPLLDMVFKAAACNFFQAIGEGRLIIQVEDRRPDKDDTINQLDQSTLPAILEANKDEKRSMSFLGGNRAYEAYKVFLNGNEHVYETKLGVIRVHIRELESGNPRVDLCRNGMWITDDRNIPGFYYQFQDRNPFHALLLLDSTTGDRLHELVRNAEGPLHDKLDVGQRLSVSEARDLRGAFREIKDWLKAMVPELKSDSYSPDDFLALDFGDNDSEGSAKRAFWGRPTPVVRRDTGQSHYGQGSSPDPNPNPGPGPGPGPQPPPRPRPILRNNIHATSVPLGTNNRRISIECLEDCENAVLRLCIDENIGATCDSLRRSQNATVYLNRVKIKGKPTNKKSFVKQNGKNVGVRLGDIVANSTLDLEIEYELPNSLLVLPGQLPALRVEVFKAVEADEGN